MVRLKLQSGLMGERLVALALAWLIEREAEEAAQAARCRAQEASIARQEKKISRIVNAIIIGIATLTLIFTVLAWVYPRR